MGSMIEFALVMVIGTVVEVAFALAIAGVAELTARATGRK